MKNIIYEIIETIIWIIIFLAIFIPNSTDYWLPMMWR